MKSPLLALFVRAVRQDVRSGATYWARAGVSAILLLALAIVGLTSSWVGAPGRGFFVTIITLQLMAITFVGLSYFASAIAEEKEEQTLGLLRMTGLDALSILLGKSTSRLCGALLFVTAQLPFTIFAITLGGVSLRQILAAYCTLVAFTFFLCNLALLGSVLARRTGGAVVFCLCAPVLLGIAWAALEGADYLVRNYYGLRWPLGRLAAVIPLASPLRRLQEVLGTGFSGPPIGAQVFVDLAFGAGCFLLAWASFERLCDRSSDKTFAVSRVRPGGLVVKRPLTLRWLHPPRVWNNALLWKDFYFLHGGRTAFALRTLFYGGAVVFDAWGLMGSGSPMAYFNAGAGLSSILPFLFSIDLAIVAGRIFRVELNEQTLGTLVSLPCGIRQIAGRKMLAGLLAVAPGALSAIADQMLFLFCVGNTSGTGAAWPRAEAFALMFSGWGTTILTSAVVVWLSLQMKRGAAPLGWVLTYTLSGIAFGVCMIVIMLLATAASYDRPWMQSFASPMMLAPILAGVLSLGAAWMVRGAGLVKLEELTREN